MGAVVGALAFTVARVPASAGSGIERIFWLGVTGGTAALGGLVYIAVFRRVGGIESSDIERLRTLRIPMRGLILRLLTGEHG
jgi:hypothetical protein